MSKLKRRPYLNARGPGLQRLPPISSNVAGAASGSAHTINCKLGAQTNQWRHSLPVSTVTTIGSSVECNYLTDCRRTHLMILGFYVLYFFQNLSAFTSRWFSVIVPSLWFVLFSMESCVSVSPIEFLAAYCSSLVAAIISSFFYWFNQIILISDFQIKKLNQWIRSDFKEHPQAYQFLLSSPAGLLGRVPGTATILRTLE